MLEKIILDVILTKLHSEFWASWSDYEACSKSCDGGRAIRSRICKNGNPGDNGCPGEAQESKDCETQPCGKNLSIL